MSYVLLVSDTDGTELCFGPFDHDIAMQRLDSMKQAFPNAHTRVLPVLSVNRMSEEFVART